MGSEWDMTRGSRKGKKKVNKRPKLPTAVSPSIKAAESASLPPGVAKLQAERTVFASKEVFIMAPVESCFKMVASQLEHPLLWDPIIINTQPVSNVRGQIGATSWVTLNLGGRKLGSLAMICRYHPNGAISWVLSKKPKVREDWRLAPKPHGTMVSVVLAYEVPGWAIERFLYKIMRWKKVEQDLDTMVTRLKAAVEVPVMTRGL